MLIVTSQSLQSPKYHKLINHNKLDIVDDLSLLESEVSENNILSLATGVADVILLGFNCHGVATRLAQVQPVFVHNSTSACVASSTLPAAVVVALATEPLANVDHAPASYL